MGDKTNIAWTDSTWNPVSGCTPISEGCRHCYAQSFAERWRGIPGHPYEQGFDLKLWPERLKIPAGWKQPRKVFVCSMADLFHKDVPDSFRDQVYSTMIFDGRRHTYQVLTKRATEMREYVDDRAALPNVWHGVTVENADALWRIKVLQRVPSYIRFLSLEPLLGQVELDLEGIDWVIVAGESGAGYRPMDAAWALSARDQCVKAGVRFFFKGWGGPTPNRWLPILEGRTWNEFPA